MSDIETADLRLVTLRSLDGSSGRQANERLLQAQVEQWGHVVAADRLRTELAWLEEQRLVALREIGGVVVATITRRGLDVVVGSAVVPGVRRPEPAASAQA